jgi:glutathione peroxidase
LNLTKLKKGVLIMSIYEFRAKKMNGQEICMEEYKGKVVVIVNTASKCGFTPQFKELEEIYKEYKEQGFEILGFPCNQFKNQDPANNEEINNFCQLNYGVTFTMFEKIDVNGEEAHPLYKFLQNETKGILGGKIKWNFAKFLINRQGEVIQRYAPITSPGKMKKDIENLL